MSVIWAVAIAGAAIHAAGVQTTPPPHTSTSAPASATDTPDDDIVVVGQNGDKTRLTADSLRDAAQAYEKYRAEFAPNAPFQFEIRNTDPAKTRGLTLYLRHRLRERDGSFQTRDVPLDQQGRFLLPIDLATTAAWELRTTPNRAGLQISPLILSPGTDITDRRMGDLRLQCRVTVAFARISVAFRALVSALNPCNNRSFGIYAPSRKPLLSAEIPGNNIVILNPKRPNSYLIPLSNKRVANDDRLKLTYK
ncbi:MAG: hypothetical protein ACKVOB_08195 [Sphingomonas sp.]